MLTGTLVQLRPESDEDEAMLYGLAADLETWEERTPRSPGPLTLAAFRQTRAERGDDGSVEFVVAVGGSALGRCTLFHEDPLVRQAEVGVALVADARGRGYGTDALRVLVEFAFTRRNLRRLYLSTLASNAAALASYVKVGFVEEGRRREHCWVRGRYDDEVEMGLLRSEWVTPA
jgi:RimJ/RimL family protein N-acetyltransferase